jgi:hypothetical protein
MDVQIPPVLVLIVSKIILAGAPDQNVSFTHWENLKWDTPNSMMVCWRNEIQLYDPVEGMKLNPADNPGPPLNPNFAIATQCARAGITLATEWDQAHRNTPWRVWRVGCPAPAPIGYKRSESVSHTTVSLCPR